MPAVIGRRLAVAGSGVAMLVLHTGQPARSARFAGPAGSVAGFLRRAGMRAGLGSPVVVDGRPWGVVITATARPGRLRPEAGHRLAAFAELAATAIPARRTPGPARAIVSG
jgi:GAF domain-containing protein